MTRISGMWQRLMGALTTISTRYSALSTQYRVLIARATSPRRLLFAITLVVSAVAIADAADRPNILWLVAEDFSPDLGCYGTQEVSTPKIWACLTV